MVIPLWLAFPANPDEIVISDEEAKQAARASLEPEVTPMGYDLSTIRVTRLGETKIVRADIVVRGSRRKVGNAIRVITSDEIQEGINLTGPGD